MKISRLAAILAAAIAVIAASLAYAEDKASLRLNW